MEDQVAQPGRPVRRFRLLWVALVVLSLALVATEVDAYRRAPAIEQLALYAARNRRAEDWLGKPLPAAVAARLTKDSEDSYSLVWVFDPENCPTCMEGPHDDWQTLVASDRIEGLIIFGGTGDGGTPEALAELAAVEGPERLLEHSFQYSFRSLRLLLAPSGIIVAVDSRVPAAGCDWSFEAQLSEIMGLDTQLRLRSP